MGLFGGGYQNSGVGIAKDAPKKKPFFAFMEIFGRKFWKLLQVNLIFSLFLIPGLLATLTIGKMHNETLSIILTVFLALVQLLLLGPSIAGMTKVLRNFSQERHTYVWTDYINAMKSNWKPACLVGIVDMVLAFCIGCGTYVYPSLIESTGNMFIYVPFILMYSVGVTALMMNYFIFLMMISTNLSFKGILKNSFALTCVSFKKCLLTTVICLLISAVFSFLILVDINFALLLIIMPVSIMGLIICFNTYPVIQKYVINPYYEQKGEVNPELKYQAPASVEEEPVFEDQGGKEAPIVKKKKSKRGKTIS